MSIYNILPTRNNLHIEKNIVSNNLNKTHSSLNFSTLLKKSITKINNIQNDTYNSIKNFETNQNSISLNDVMIDLQKSSLAIHIAVQIKNKVISAYKEIMNIQL